MSPIDLNLYKEFAHEKLHVEFGDIQLLATALTHRSYVNEHKKSTTSHNERLEFLGDAVLELAVTDYLYNHYDEPEGILTSWRAALVRTESIGESGEALGYGPLLRLSRGEKQGSERARKQIMANAFEAIIGAIYLDKGYVTAETFILANIVNKLEAILAVGSWRDAKSQLQEMAQRIDGFTPIYKVLEEDGPDHDKIFSLGVFVGNKLKGKGSGSSKQLAQQQAAEAAVKKYQKEASSD